MKKQVLFLQGAGRGAYEADNRLVDNLRHLLGSEFEVHYPMMPDEDNPDYSTWKQQIESELTTLNGNVILVGHSLGASILIKYLAENTIEKTISGIFLIATPYWGGSGGWRYDGYETLALQKDFMAKLPKSARIFLYHGSDDETVPFAHLSLYAQKLSQATKRELEGRGHQLNNNLSEVAEDIKSL